MPNWCTVTITLQGDDANVLACLDKIAPTHPDGGRHFQFDNVVQMPTGLDERLSADIKKAVWYMTIAPSLNPDTWNKFNRYQLMFDALKIKTLVNNDMGQMEIALRALRNQRKHEAMDMGEWCGAHWDVGSDLSETETDINTDPEYGPVSLVFDTPWQPPIAIFEALHRQFPNIAISATFEEPGNGVYGRYENGSLVYDTPCDEDGEDIEPSPLPSL
ncbi:MAG: hypothetical protein CVV05_00940 [Gammaproteobacteria bacterium HGW-Gammaproteobacteria-1]|jgi:hypothetical protein|nr:MAG: hypothetical protein CVV05_00940 [Gammaproteobacteria bacterium HGW-Gammaproteobacteria-1]